MTKKYERLEIFFKVKTKEELNHKRAMFREYDLVRLEKNQKITSEYIEVNDSIVLRSPL